MFALLWLVPFTVGTAIGLSGVFTRRLPLVMAAMLISGYVAFVAWYGVRTAACPHCNAGDGDRLYYLPIYAGFWGSILGALLLGIAAGALAGRPFGQRHRKRSQPM
jgi:hypothetical protein